MKLINTIIRLQTILLLVFTFLSCDNDDGNATNETACNYEGFSYLDTNNNDQTLIAEADLQTQFFPNASNGPFGASGIEISSYVSSPTLFFATNTIAANQTGTGILTIDNVDYDVTVTCQREGNAVGEEIRLDVTYSSIEVEFCVTIDEVVN